MNDPDHYKKGREAAGKMLDALEGEIIESVWIEHRGAEYPKVKMLLSEYPIQEFEVLPKYLTVNGQTIWSMDLEKGERKFLERATLESWDKTPDVEGYNLDLTFTVTGDTDE